MRSHLYTITLLGVLGSVVAFAAALFAAQVVPALAQNSSCAVIQSGQHVGSGYGLPWSVVSSAQELLIDVICSGGRAEISVGTGKNTQYIYHRGYAWSGEEWQQISFTAASELLGEAWYRGRANAMRAIDAEDRQTNNYLVAYVCEWGGTGWKCGCQDSACTQPAWQLQAYRPGAEGEDDATRPLAGFKRVESAEELQQYLERFAEKGSTDVALRSLSAGVVAQEGVVALDTTTQAATAEASDGDAAAAGAAAPSRYSETNVQVHGIDEPDIVKTDGEYLYLSTQRRYGILPLRGGGGIGVGAVEPAVAERVVVDEESGKAPTTKVVDAFPLEELALINEESIEEQGEMLLVEDENMLIIFAHPELVAYDVADPANPEKVWTYELKDRSQVTAARLVDDTVYLVTATWLNRSSPCPIRPMARAGTDLIIPCGDVWVPSIVSPVNVSYTISALDPASGETTDSLTFAGDGSSAVVSVFADNLYLSYRLPQAMTEVMLDFYAEELDDYLSTDAVTRINTIKGYDITERSKLVEVERIVNQETSSMDKDERLQFENELHDRLSEYLESRLRETDRTTIARVPLDTLSIAARGEIPGHLLNQFSMDEYDGHLRVASTIGSRFRGVAESRNDVYVLDMDLDIVGRVEDLGLTEQIYAVRFMGEQGYLVTFRRIDPFYVLDLSDPQNPDVTGELKIPGFSSYLEPLGGDLILGVGREGSGVKLSVFDVADPTSPQEVDTYQLAEAWTEVGNNHRAFLRDPRHEVFFIPAGRGGHIFSYEDSALSLVKSISGFGVRRALYIDDYMYVIGENELTVLDETTWQATSTLALQCSSDTG